MILWLRAAFLFALVLIIGMIVYASLDRGVLAALRDLSGDAWIQTTLVDIYISFLTIWLWIAYKERSWVSRLLWLVLVLTLGSVAITTYVLIQLFRVESHARLRDVLLPDRERA
ncbi:MAG: DUF1475 family protein [Ectothiorhodospiraceae bacterium]|nr:DUF1475 family protein [Ectothiorhodospiraceae bacterium]MCH8504187.1 DUF1475 domain-containing protein [Ectothiorhodospiraceae bacterium]